MINYRYIALEKYCKDTGLKLETARGYMKNGKWMKGKQYVKPEGIILVDLKGIEQWAEAAAELENPVKHQSKSVSHIGASGVARGSSSSPRPLI